MAVARKTNIGDRYGKLLVIGFQPRRITNAKCICQCDCGNFASYRGVALRSGVNTHCGCEESPEKKFERRISPEPNSGCWLYDGEHVPFGYGRFRISGKRGSPIRVLAHRYAYELWVGKIPDDMVVMHLCDNPTCCNPSHLKAAPQRENVIDMVQKGRRDYAAGDNNKRSKYSDSLIRYIRSAETPSPQLSRDLGIDRNYINAIRRGVVRKRYVG